MIFASSRQHRSLLRDHKRIDFGKRESIASYAVVSAERNFTQFFTHRPQPQAKASERAWKAWKPAVRLHRFAEDLSRRLGGHLLNLPHLPPSKPSTNSRSREEARVQRISALRVAGFAALTV